MNEFITEKKGIYIISVLGLFLGCTLDYLVNQFNTHLFYYSVLSLFCLFYALAYDEHHVLRLLGTSIVSAILLSLPIFSLGINNITAHQIHLIAFFVAFPFFIYVGHCFHYAFHHDNSWNVDYRTLFAAVWTTLPLICVALVFSSLVNALIFLAAFIFKTVGNNYLWHLYFENIHFRFISNTTFLFMGIGIGLQNIKIIYNIRFLLLKMMYGLFPVLAVISILYCILYSINWLTGGSSSVEPLVVLLPLNIFGIIFFNAYFQDGTSLISYPYWIQILLSVYRLVLFVLTVCMTWNIVSKIMIETNQIICLLCALFLTFTYATTALCSKETEILWIRRGNIAAALFFLVALLLSNLPFAPIDISIGTQSSVRMM